MNSIKQYVSDQLLTLIDEFPNIQVSCRYDECCEAFYVKVLPAVEYNENMDLTYKTIDILDNILFLYPNESIGFFTEGCTINFDNMEYTLTGKDFIPHLLPAKNQKFEVAVPKRKRREPLHPYVGRTV